MAIIIILVIYFLYEVALIKIIVGILFFFYLLNRVGDDEVLILTLTHVGSVIDCFCL